LGAPSTDPSDPKLLATRDADPVAFFDALAQASAAEGHSSLTCKVFARQVALTDLEAILRQPNVSVIFLTRRRIDRYISGVKARITGDYVKTDSTGVMASVSVAAFLKQAFEHDRGYDAMLDCVVASGVRHTILNYERDLDVPADLRADRINRALGVIGFPGQVDAEEAENWIIKQDTTPDWRSKIDNGFEVAAALAGVGLLDYAETAPLSGFLPPARPRVSILADPRDDALLDQGGYNFAFASDPVITFTAIQFGRSYFAEWMAGPEPAFGTRRGLHFLKPTWTMETTNLKPLADCLRRAEACNPGHYFVAKHVSVREAEMYRAVGIRSISGSPNLFTDERHFEQDAPPHPDLPPSDTLYVARLAPWKNHHLAAGLQAPLFVYGNPVDPSEDAHFARLRKEFTDAHFVNHDLDPGRYRYLGRQELASVMSRARVSLALSEEEGCMRGATECLLAGLPIVSVASIGGRELLFTPDTALIVEPTPEAVREGVARMLERRLSRDEVRRATLSRLRDERQRFLEAANRVVGSVLGPLAPRITMEPLMDYTIRYVPLRSMVEGLR
jgi:glycosyltransferase involved in cell wall biosynthesis